MEKPNLTTKQIALVAIFAALFVVLAYIGTPIKIPTTVGSIDISFSALIASVFGLVLGPYLGAAAALLGSSIAWATVPPTAGSVANLPFLLAPFFNALIVGFVFYKKWKWGLAVFAVMIVAFLFTPPVSPITGQSSIAGLTVSNWWIATAVLFDKIFALLLILPLAFFGKKLSVAHGAALFFIIAFVGNQADNMWGSLAFALPPVYNGIYQMQLVDVQGAFLLSPFLYPAIRLAEAAIATLIAVPLMKALSGTPWLWKKDSIMQNGIQPKTEAATPPPPAA
jgi:hypothetical protein